LQRQQLQQQQQQEQQRQQQQQQAQEHQRERDAMANGYQTQAPRTPSSTPRKDGKRSSSNKKKTPKTGSSKKDRDSNNKKESSNKKIKLTKTIMGDDDKQWFTGCVPLGLDDDKYWLSELQVYLRANFAEAFGATEEDIAAPMHGRNKPIALGQVGIRCMHCKRK
jgi:hypothetical protein